jgi:plastocyanin
MMSDNVLYCPDPGHPAQEGRLCGNRRDPAQAKAPRRPSGHHRAPWAEVLERYQDAGAVPFSCPGHKLGHGADRALVAMLVHAGTRLAAWLLPARTPAVAAVGAGGWACHNRTIQLDLDPALDWRDARMDHDAPSPPEPPPDWARVLRRSRYRHQQPFARWAVGLLLLVSVGMVMFQVGHAVAPTRPAAAEPAPTVQDPVTPMPMPTRTSAPAPPTTTAPRRPRVLTLVARNVRTETNPNRVYLAPGQVDATQARHGKQPEFVVRPGEALRVRVDNQDRYIHSFTFAKGRVNLDAWEGTVSAATFKAPSRPGVYQFYCRYRKIGMAGTLVVAGSPVRR